MIITTTDPVTGADLEHPETRPYVIEGQGLLAVKIYFESAATRRAWLDTASGHPGNHFVTTLDNPDPGMADYN